jgi:hypothetical protein
MSAVLTLAALITPNVAEAILFAIGSSLYSRRQKRFSVTEGTKDEITDPRCLSIIVALSIIAVGLARLVPMRSWAIWRHPGSNKAYSCYIDNNELLSEIFDLGLTRPTLHPGTMPGPPTRAAPMLETIAPYRLGMTITSN